MKQVLTAQIAAKYFGCRVLVRGEIKATMCGLKTTLKNDGLLYNYAGCNLFTVIPDCQLILWRPEDIRDEDAIELAKIYCFKNPAEQNEDSIDACYISGDKLHIAPNGLPAFTEYISELPYKAANFLRASEHNGKPKPAYDLDGLIGSCAVDGKLLTV